MTRVSFALVATALVAVPAFAQGAAAAALQVTATVTLSPPAIVLQWPGNAAASHYTISKRAAGALNWNAPTSIVGGSATMMWSDGNAAVGTRNEYRIMQWGTTAANSHITAGIEADLIEERGRLILLVDDTQATPLASEIDRLIRDLVGDGWQVVRHDVSRTASVTSIKALIVTEYNAAPNQTNALFLLGHVPVPYSGNINPDGHSNHRGAWPADAYYGDVNGTWTDVSVNNSSASRSANRNVPGDGKFDQSVIPSLVELAVGRVDLANMPAFAASETALLQAYLDKDHDYRNKVFAVDHRAVIDDHFGYFGGEAFAASGWRNFSALVGPANVIAADYFTTLNTTSGNGYLWSYGCGGGSYSSANGIGNTNSFTTSTNRGVFTILFGSYFGDWDSTNNFLRAPLGSGWTLANVWAGRPHWLLHQMGLGQTIGYCARDNHNDTSAGGIGVRQIHIALMGDPTLRQHVIAPASNVAVSAGGGQATVSWSASQDTVGGYHIYRAAQSAGPFTRVTATPITGTTYINSSPLVGPQTYMVRALRLEATPTGSYWNMSQGAFATTCLPQVAASHVSYGLGCSTPAMAVSATPAPIATATTGTLVTYTVTDIPETAPGSGVHTGFVIVSLQGDMTGTSLAPIGAAGCDALLSTLDLLLPFAGNGSTATAQFQIPVAAPCGLPLYAQTIALVLPFSAPNTQNAAGIVTSNGLRSVIGPF
ncbi:MAG: hypothetical protein ACJA0V_003770 [Planctomycetota bacterium]|jgi:hypothetical protein